MFHERGYGAVGLAELTAQLDIRPPSFYAAFGSKAGFFERILTRYAETVLPLALILRPGRPVKEALNDLLEEAARTYTRNPKALGCLVLEASRATGAEEAAELARRVDQRRREDLRAFVHADHPDVADQVCDVMASTMSGLSACAREGWSEQRLLQVARTAAAGIGVLLEPQA